MTPEAFEAVQEYLQFRRDHGEQITGESLLMRDKFQSSLDKYSARKSMATNPQRLKIEGVKKLLNRALASADLRGALHSGEHRHEFKLSHGYRKYFKSNAERIMRPLNVELLMDHKTGISDSYWRPTESELLEDYLRAVDYLAIEQDQKSLINFKSNLSKQQRKMSRKLNR